MSVILFILVLFLLVLVHEWGHFIVAKRSGMRVDEFGIGFPPRLFGIRRGETLYSLNAIPLGGFVKIFGEDTDLRDTVGNNARAFSNRPLYAQALVLVAGVSMNILFAWLLFSLAFALGTKTSVGEASAGPDAKLTVLSILPDSPAEKAGVVLGDIITSVATQEGHPVGRLYPSDVSTFIEEYSTVSMSIFRDGKEERLSVTSARGVVPDEPDRAVLGITMGLIEENSMPIHTAIIDGGLYTLSSLKSVIVGIVTLVYDAAFFKADLSGIAGPVGIAGLVGDAASFGLTSLMMFSAFISLNLAVINLLPFPALDGGRLLFVCIEAIKGSSIAPKVAQTFNFVGFALLMLLMVAVTYNDILRLVR